jgi:phenylacetate-coenzyme A ligase PaaK-like adenylate-forming protein
MTALVRRIRARGAATRSAEQKDFYANWSDLAPSLAWQLDRFNDGWNSLRAHVPYWRALAAQGRLPDRFSSWEEFSSLLPPLSRADVRAAGSAMYNPRRPPSMWRSTGGSTGEPLQIPVWKSEPAIGGADLWYARSWFDVSPRDKLFLIWGHSHLLGHGFRGWLNARRRMFDDWLVGYHRASAYDLSDGALRAAGRALIRFRPSYVLGYAAALDRFARVHAAERSAFRALALKAVIATAESFSNPASRMGLAELFGCPVVMEYGAMETGPLAHQRPDGAYQVFWRHYYVESIPFPSVAGSRQIAVTSLYPRCLPLVRYQLGDLIESAVTGAPPSRELSAIVGRCNDLVHLPEGRVVHSEAFTHAVKESAMAAFQVRETEAGIQLRYTAPRCLSEMELTQIRRRLSKISAELEKVSFERVDALDATIAGKTRRVLQQP